MSEKPAKSKIVKAIMEVSERKKKELMIAWKRWKTKSVLVKAEMLRKCSGMFMQSPPSPREIFQEEPDGRKLWKTQFRKTKQALFKKILSQSSQKHFRFVKPNVTLPLRKCVQQSKNLQT